jgi:FixJ family two-component response regulator
MANTNLAHIVGGDDSLGGPLGRMLEAAGFHVAHHPSADEFLQEPTAPPGGTVLEVHMQDVDAPQLRSLLGERQLGMPLIVITSQAQRPAEGNEPRSSAIRDTRGALQQEDNRSQPMLHQQLVAAFRGALMPFDESGPQMQQRQEHHQRLKTLTRREREVLERLVKGRLNKQIAAELVTSERTVKAHRQQVMRKMHAGSLAELVTAMTRY